MLLTNKTVKMIAQVVVLVPLLQGIAHAETQQQDEYDCVVDPSKKLTLSSSVIGILDRVLVSRGDRVMAGQVVAYLESDVEKASLDIAKLKSDSKANVKAAKAQLDFARQQLERAEDLKKKGAIATQNLEELQAKHSVALQELEMMEHEARRYLLERRLAEQVLAQRTIESPVDGLVLKIDRGEGEYIFQEASIMTVAQIDPLYIETFIPVERYGDIKTGMIGEVTLNFPVKMTYQSEIIVVDQIFDTASGTTGVRLKLANPGGLIPAGQRCRVHF